MNVSKWCRDNNINRYTYYKYKRERRLGELKNVVKTYYMNNRFVIIGSGNLATQLSQALSSAGNSILQVYSRTEAHAGELAAKLGCEHTSNLSDIRTDADAYIISIKDDAVSEVAKAICADKPQAIFMHTAGSVPMDVFTDCAKHYGVLYPSRRRRYTARDHISGNVPDIQPMKARFRSSTYSP